MGPMRAARRQHEDALGDARPALRVEQADQRLADTQLGDGGLRCRARRWARIVSAALLTAFWSRGVKARSACCTRLPS
jgi:hypothetical protein